jgi:FHA domain
LSASCPNGHDSAADDYCDVCGLKIGPSEPPSTAGAPGGHVEPERLCPVCQAVVAADDRYCEDCGHDLDVPAPDDQPSGREAPSTTPNPPKMPSTTPNPPKPSSSASWEIVAEADQAYFQRFDHTADLAFPAVAPTRRFSLTGDKIEIGRRSVSQGIFPEIDLSAVPTDGAISHSHAMLVRQADGSWVLYDPGSTNGVYLDEATEPVPRDVPIAIQDGTRVHLGAWTTLTLRRTDTTATPAPGSAATARQKPDPRMVHPPSASG